MINWEKLEKILDRVIFTLIILDILLASWIIGFFITLFHG